MHVCMNTYTYTYIYRYIYIYENIYIYVYRPRGLLSMQVRSARK